MTAYPDIIYKKEGHIATIIMNRPDKMNSFSPQMSDSLHRAISDSSTDKKIRVIILTANGRAFCAGADVKQMAQQFDETGKSKGGMVQVGNRSSLYLIMQKCNKPIIAAVNGIAVGGGLDLALACDIRIASDQAKFAEVFIRRGLMPASGGTYFLPRLIGIDRALLLAWTGDMLDAKEAEQIGLVTMVVPHAELETAAMDLAEKLAKGPPLAIQHTKRAIYDGLTADLETNLKMIAPALQELNQTKDHEEGARAFVEKREPFFKGE